MGRFSTNNSYGHYCKYHTGWGGWYEIDWRFDRYYPNSRQRHPHSMSRTTDEAGARRFCKKWDVEFLESEAPK